MIKLPPAVLALALDLDSMMAILRRMHEGDTATFTQLNNEGEEEEPLTITCLSSSFHFQMGGQDTNGQAFDCMEWLNQHGTYQYAPEFTLAD